MHFGLSTHLFHGERLTREHLARVKARGFDVLEIFMTRTHVDYHDREAVRAVRGWTDELDLNVWSVHTPICESAQNGVWGRAYSTASRTVAAREEAIRETVQAIEAARELSASVAVLHLGVPDVLATSTDQNDEAAAEGSLDVIAAACTKAGVRLAVEVIPNALATATAVAAWLDRDRDLGSAGACLDVGHAHMTGGAVEAIDALGGHIITTHVHDNRGRSDDHLLPFDGTIEWTTTLTALAKHGYTGPLIFEVPDHGDAWQTLERLASARGRIQAILNDVTAPFPFEDEA
jgi:sugar phosphate isomerase/epimerase